MAYSTQRAVSDGTMAYLDLTIAYIKRADINVFYNGLPADPATWSWVGTTDKRISFHPNVPNGVEVLLKRTTQIDAIINRFANGAKFNNATMDQDFLQLLYLNQEAVEGAALTDIFNDVDFHGYKIKNLGVAVDDNDAITFGQAKAQGAGAWTAASAAQTAQTAAEAARDLAAKWASQLTTTVDGSNYSAKQYALNASGSASAAASSAGAASTSAGASASSATDSNTYAGQSAGYRDQSQGYRDQSQTYSNNSSDSAALSQKWANYTAGTVDGTEYSAKYYAQAAQAAAAGGSAFATNVTVTKADPSLVLNDNASGVAHMLLQKAGVNAWEIAGGTSSLNFNRMNASGTIVSTPISVNWTNGLVTFADGINAGSKVIAGVANGVAATDAANVSNLNSLPLGTNLLHNARFQVNQRGVSSGSAAGAGYPYKLDRWRVVVAGQAASWVANGAYYTVTCPAGGWEQVLEGVDIFGGSYYVAWNGTATCELGPVGSATAVPNGSVVTLAAGASVQIRWKSGTLELPSIVAGTRPQAVQWPSYPAELARCQLYYRNVWVDFEGYSPSNTQNLLASHHWNRMRSTPVQAGLANGSSPSYGGSYASPPTFIIRPEGMTVYHPVNTGLGFVVNYCLGLSCDL